MCIPMCICIYTYVNPSIARENVPVGVEACAQDVCIMHVSSAVVVRNVFMMLHVCVCIRMHVYTRIHRTAKE